MVSVVAVIFARGGSKGIPRKNLRPVGGIPLVGWSVRAARAARCVDRVVVSTDDPEIAEVAAGFGAEVPWLRPEHLAEDGSSEWDAWRHAVDELAADERGMDVLLSVPPTAPLRSPDDLDRCVDLLLGSDADLVLTVSPARRHPAFNMVQLDDAGRVALLSPGGGHLGRQTVPPAYDVTTVAYATRPAHVRRASGVLDGNVRAVVVPPERALDIDDLFDLHVAEALTRHPFDPEAL